MRTIRFILAVLVCCLISSYSYAVSIIRDTETEELLLGYVRSIFNAAGLDSDNAEVVIVNDPSINAFVAGGQTIFIHTGLLLRTESPDEVVFVLSHETGHIVGGHIVRGYQAMQNAQTTALISTVLGGVLAVAGGRPDAGIAVMIGGQSSAMGLFTKYRQTEESSADRTAVDIVRKLGYSMDGFNGIMKMIKAEEKLNQTGDSSYLRTHPMTQTRIDELKRFLKNPAPLHKEQAFDLVRAKLKGFLEDPDKVLAAYTQKTLPAKYARAIAYYRKHDYPKAFEILNGLIEEKPDNPYFHELKGQLLFETGKLDESAVSYRQAHVLKSDSALIALSYAQVLLEQGGKEKAQEAEELLRFVVRKDPSSSFGWQLLAKSYDRQGRGLYADYAMVEYERASGRLPQAKQRATKLVNSFKDDPVVTQHLKDIMDLEEK